jgi:hypothetical protein
MVRCRASAARCLRQKKRPRSVTPSSATTIGLAGNKVSRQCPKKRSNQRIVNPNPNALRPQTTATRSAAVETNEVAIEVEEDTVFKAIKALSAKERTKLLDNLILNDDSGF